MESLVAGYRADVDVIRGVSFTVERGKLVAIVGPNGAGKSTLIKCLCGLVRARAGRVVLNGEEITNFRPHQIARRGVGYVPQRDNVFPRLTVEENLQVGLETESRAEAKERHDQMFAMFPALARRRRQPAGILSGGERQMLAVARALIRRPSLMLLDEPSAGVDPKTLAAFWERIEGVQSLGVTTVLVEQNARQALSLANEGYVLDVGQVRYGGTGRELLADARIAELYLGG